MKMPAHRTNPQSGQALITAIIFLLALTFMGFGLVAMSTVDVSASHNLRLAYDSLDAAEQGAFLGMSYAGNNSTLFVTGKNEGDTVRINSTVNGNKNQYDREQYDVMLTMGGRTEQPPGEIKDNSKGHGGMRFRFVAVKVASRGMVSEGRRSTFRDVALFDWADKPMVTQTLEMTFRVRKATYE